MIAALFVETNGAYYGIPDVDPWDEARDARLYPGPWPVVAHPPCSRWCRLAVLIEKTGGKRRGDDDGCFASALASVRRWGGVLEHPASSYAWAEFGLPRPPSTGYWVRGIDGGWVCHVEQDHYGHAASKATWLYAYGISLLPSMRWGRARTGMVVTTSRRTRGVRREMPKADRKRTPPAFRDLLLDMARSVSQERAA